MHGIMIAGIRPLAKPLARVIFLSSPPKVFALVQPQHAHDFWDEGDETGMAGIIFGRGGSGFGGMRDDDQRRREQVTPRPAGRR